LIAASAAQPMASQSASYVIGGLETKFSLRARSWRINVTVMTKEAIVLKSGKDG
jgi:hypothetical protein